jgi:TolA-binding protein
MSEKKMVRRVVAIALVVTICFILVAVAVEMVLSLSVHVTEKDETITNLNIEVFNKDSQISQLNSNITDLQNQLTSQNSTINLLTSNLTNLQEIASLQKSTLMYDDSVIEQISSGHIVQHNVVAYGLNLSITFEETPIPIDYAGYVIVSITSSSSNSTFVGLSYSSKGFSYDNTVTVGVTGQAYFPILPTNTLDIKIGNTDTSNLDIQRITITYYY